MITRTIKYTASDGTEHDSPQAAATHELQNYLYRLIEQCWPGIPTKDLVEVTTGLARNPEALRDAVNAYFEDLEAHPDVDVTTMTLADYERTVEFDVTNMWHCDGNHPSPVCWDPQCWHKTPPEAIIPGAGYIPTGTPVYGNPNDPTTWRADLPVDHPQYCRPFGTRED